MDDFKGFEAPQENWSKLPHQLIAELPRFTSLGELKVVLYVLRHTWGYRNQQGIPDQYKRISLDEFMNGRKTANGERLDSGTGMTKPTIISGIKRAIKHGFLYSHTDESDAARTTKYYSLTEQGLNSFTPTSKESLPPPVKNLYPDHRKKQEKDTNKDIAPDESDAIKTPPKDKRDILFDAIAYYGYGIPAKNITPEQKALLDGTSGRIGKVKKVLLKINPELKVMGDSEIRTEVIAFWTWLQTKMRKETGLELSSLRDSAKWAEYYTEYCLREDKQEKSNTGQSTAQKMLENEKRIQQLKGDN